MSISKWVNQIYVVLSFVLMEYLFKLHFVSFLIYVVSENCEMIMSPYVAHGFNRFLD